MKASLRFRVHKQGIAAPSFRVPAPAVSTKDAGGYHATMGIDADLMTGAKKATRAMIEWLVAEHGLTRADAYVLCSAVGDLRIIEIVDSGVWTVAMTMPLSIFQTA
jgi:acetamidase/formamidase